MIGVEIRSENNIGLIILNNPNIHNALRKSDLDDIRLTLKNWKTAIFDAIIITGTGKSFSSGLFLNELDSLLWDENPISIICEAIEKSKCPVICGLNGGAYGGAVEIALACDFRVGDNKLSLTIPAAKLGIHYEPSGIRRSLNLLGPSITRQLFLLGETILVDKINKTDFIDFWVEEDETVFEKAKELAVLVGNNAPLAVGGMKRVIIEILDNSLDRLGADNRIKECLRSVDHEEALLARIEKRSPKFRGI